MLSKVAVAPGTICRIHFELCEQHKHDGSFLIRSCHPCEGGNYKVGGQHIIDSEILTAAGIDPGAVASDAQTLAQEGARPPWEVRQHVVAPQAISVANLSAISVCVRKDLTVSEGILDCTLDVTGQLIAPKASLVGGTAHVLRGVSIGVLGSADSTPTLLVLGQSLGTSMMLGAVNAEIAERSAAIKTKQAAIDELNARLPNTLTHADRETLTVVMSELPDLVAKNARMSASVAKLKKREASIREVRLEVAKGIHPGVTIVAGGTRLTFSKRLAGPVVLGLLPDGDFGIISTSDASLGPIGDCATVARLAA